jgi:tRNA nucleotidyltransferase (CCA-adding enzyme)
MKPNHLINSGQLDLLKRVARHASSLRERVYLVGGVVRDLLLGGGLKDKDLDFMVQGDSERLAKLLALELGAELRLFPKFRTAKIILAESLLGSVDFAAARSEIYERPGELPKVAPSSIEEDLRRRDFTINAMAVEVGRLTEWLEGAEPSLEALKLELLDLYGGVCDLERRLIRILHEKSFVDDPTRIFRAFRYQARIQGALEAGTKEALGKALAQNVMVTISNVRKLNELNKICEEPAWLAILNCLEESRILSGMGLVADWPILRTKLGNASGRSVSRAGTERYQLFLSQCYALLPEAQREANFRALGFGRKSLREFSK